MPKGPKGEEQPDDMKPLPETSQLGPNLTIAVLKLAIKPANT